MDFAFIYVVWPIFLFTSCIFWQVRWMTKRCWSQYSWSFPGYLIWRQSSLAWQMYHQNVRKYLGWWRGGYPQMIGGCGHHRRSYNALLTSSYSGDLGLINGMKFTLVGTPQGSELKDPNRTSHPSHWRPGWHWLYTTGMELLSDVINDLDVDFSANPAAAESYKNDKRNIRKIREATKKLKISLIYPLREGKRLLVLDIDYSLLLVITWCFIRWRVNPSDFGHKASDFRCATPFRVCTTSTTWILDGHIPLLWHMHLVRRLNLLFFNLTWGSGHKRAGFG